MKRRSLFGSAVAMIASVVLAGSALAAGFTNGGFETGSYTDNGSGFMTLGPGATNITDWSIGGAGVDWVHTYWPAPEGAYSLDMNAEGPGTVSQTFDTTVNDIYVVHFLLAGNPTAASTCPTPVKTLTVSATGGTSSAFSFDTTGRDYANMGWTESVYSFTATGSSATLTFASATAGACGPALDAITITETIATAATCKKGGWQTMFDSVGNKFKNQGDCVSFYATGGRNLGAIAQ